MLFAVIFADNEEQAEARQRLMKDHLDFLERHPSSIRAAGPLQDTESREGAGGLWLVEASSAEAVKRLYESDPFWPTGLRRSVQVLQWSRVFADGHRLI